MNIWYVISGMLSVASLIISTRAYYKSEVQNKRLIARNLKLVLENYKLRELLEDDGK